MSGPSTIVGPQPLSKEEMDQKLAAFDSVPLFMKSLPMDDTDDVALSALQSLAYEGTPDEVAQTFKEQGNEYFKGKRYREALGFYKQGIDALPTDPVLLEALLCNRAACNLELQNFGSVLRDCSKALTLNSRSSKAFYRSGLALMALDRPNEALDCCTRCLASDPTNSGVLMLRKRAEKAKEEKDRREKAKADRLQKEKEEKELMEYAFRERNLIAIRKDGDSTNPFLPHYDPSQPGMWIFVLPVFFLYPQYATSDIIQKFAENTTFADHISTMFPPQAPPPEWDVKRQYTDGNLVIYAMTHRKRLLKVGKKMTLRDVCIAAKGRDNQPRDGLEVKDGCLTFIVLPKGDVETKWVDEYKKTRDT